PALRDADGHRGGHRELRPGIVTGPGDGIADGGQADTHHDRVPSAIDELVDPPGLEASAEVDLRRVLHEATALLAREAPPIVRDDLPRSEPRRTDRQHVVGMARV